MSPLLCVTYEGKRVVGYPPISDYFCVGNPTYLWNVPGYRFWSGGLVPLDLPSGQTVWLLDGTDQRLKEFLKIS